MLVLVGLVWYGIGQPWPLLFWSAIALPIAHQIFVWLSWRLELKHQRISQTIGFTAYLVIFFSLFAGRFVTVVLLGSTDQGSLGLPVNMATAGAITLSLPALYTLYSVRRYFGIVRAAGADHFDEKYRHMPLVREGIFRFTSNAMYVYAFFFFWAIAIGYNSLSALVVTAFSHAYIWVHYFATEKPDMDYLYSE